MVRACEEEGQSVRVVAPSLSLVLNSPLELAQDADGLARRDGQDGGDRLHGLVLAGLQLLLVQDGVGLGL